MSILVTGARGFVGQAVMRIGAEQKLPVVAFPGDLRNSATFPGEQYATIIHLASLISHQGNWTSSDLIEVNVEGTKKLLQAYPEAKMVYVSTVDVTRPERTEYAESKLSAEAAVSSHGNCVIVRLPSIFGPRPKQDKLIPRLFRKYLRGETCTVTSNDLREYLYVDLAARGILSAMSATGMVTLAGYKISNFELDRLIGAICQNDQKILSEHREGSDSEFLTHLQLVYQSMR